MCGICGIAGFEDKKLVKGMTEAMLHRGPDDYGFYFDKNIGLGNRRLSIIDIPSGKQPIFNEDKSIAIVFNGEIYNFIAVRKGLEGKHKFYTNSDTEVIVHAYEEYGFDCVKHLEGMFAFAIYDSNKKLLFIARDALGIKPLYYIKIGKEFLFASEIKSILMHENVKREVDIESLNHFLSFRCTPLAKTMFKNINKLMPGHYLVYKDGKILIKKYWDLLMEPSIEDEHAVAKNVSDLLSNSVKSMLMSEVPLGVFLSGGIDSGTIVSYMSRIGKDSINTFSVGFVMDEYKNELRNAKIIADHFQTNHHEIIVEPQASKLLPKIVWHLDEPIADPTCIPTLMLSEKTKKDCTVVLTGEGGDEVFAGYEQYKIMTLRNKYIRRIPKTFSRATLNLVKILPKSLIDGIFKYSSGLGEEGMKRFSKLLSTNDYSEMYLNITSIFDEDEKNDLFCKEAKKITKNNILSLLKRKYFDNIEKNNLLNKMLYFDTKVILPENLLMKTDKMTMAYSIEARVPFLDNKLVEYMGKVKPSLKLKGLNEKYILRKAVKGIVPEKTLGIKKERFYVPIHNWFKDDLIGISKQILGREEIKKHGFFNHSYIDKIFKNLDKSKIFYSRQLWSLITFQLWHRIYIENENFKNRKLNLSKIL